MMGWGAFCQGQKTRGPWSVQERRHHINILELKAINLVRTFTIKEPKGISVHMKVDNLTALSYLTKMGGTKSPIMTQISKEIWEYILDRQITITAEYIPSHLM